MEDVNDYGVQMDSDLISQDFDSIDLYGEIMENDAPNDCDILFE